jgi:hypothetical protein
LIEFDCIECQNIQLKPHYQKIQIDDIGEMKKNDENFTVKIKHDSILIENET